MIEINTVVDSLPAPVWGAVGAMFGAVIAFIATIILNYGNSKRLKIQLSHDAREKNIDRMKDLRKEIYLSAVEEITKASCYFASIPNLELKNIDVSGDLQGLYVAAAKLSLVAPPQTQYAVDALGVEYAKLTFKIIAKIPPMRELKAVVGMNEAFYEQSMDEVKRVLSTMTKYNESAQDDELVYQGLQNAFKFFSEQAELYTGKRSDAQLEYNELSSNFSMGLMVDMKPLAELQTKVIIAIRKDLGVETNEVQLQAHMKQQWQEITDAVEEELSR